MNQQYQCYINRILKSTNAKSDEVNSFVENMDVSINTKRMYLYWWQKYCDENKIECSNLKTYQQQFIMKKDYLSFAETKKVLVNLWNSEIEFVFKALLETGARVSEFVSINWSNIDTDKIVIKTAKNENEYRWVFISVETVDLLNSLRNRNYDFSKINKKRIQYLLSKLGKLSNLSISLSPHVLRRTKGSLMRLNGASLEDIADVLGHKSIETTRKFYSKLDPQYLNSISKLSEIKPSDAIDIQLLRKENQILKKQIILLKNEISEIKTKNNKWNN